MKKAEYPAEIQNLIAHLKRLPGIGPRSAERVAISLLQTRKALAVDLAHALTAAVGHVVACGRCGFFRSEGGHCSVCDATERDATVICIVEQPTDILPLERSGAYRGQYHVLGGKISPRDNIHPEDLRIDALDRRLAVEPVEEVIIAVGSDVEGEATAHYLGQHLAGRENLRLTRLAQGLPAGGGLDHADDLTLFRALSGRQRL